MSRCQPQVTSTGVRGHRFHYHSGADSYQCSGQAILSLLSICERTQRRIYPTPVRACRCCAFREQCTTSRHGRRVGRRFDEDYVDRVRSSQGAARMNGRCASGGSGSSHSSLGPSSGMVWSASGFAGCPRSIQKHCSSRRGSISNGCSANTAWAGDRFRVLRLATPVGTECVAVHCACVVISYSTGLVGSEFSHLQLGAESMAASFSTGWSVCETVTGQHGTVLVPKYRLERPDRPQGMLTHHNPHLAIDVGDSYAGETGVAAPIGGP
jgi:hypothetical protein